MKSSSQPLSPKRKGPLGAAPCVTTSGNQPHLGKRRAQRFLFASVSGEREGQQEGEGKWRQTGRKAEGGSDIHTEHSVSGILTHTVLGLYGSIKASIKGSIKALLRLY